MNIYDGVLQFKGTWRTYQKRILDRTEKYFNDKKVHIVAAPGSGKTTLGIELIRRQGAPCLILSPSITIREQWIARIKEGFLVEGVNSEDWFSNNIRDIKPVTVITYQALHSCMKQYVGVLEEEDTTASSVEEAEENIRETVDFSQFDIYEEIKKSGIKTVCLDEAHHLRSEWWKALEEFLKNIPGITLISLTATPPYDSTPAQWKRYIDLCGPIDEEIFTPELVKEGSLCPHQDYVYFNWPTKEEAQAVEDYTKRAKEIVTELKASSEFAKVIASHRGILHPKDYSEQFLDNPKYFFSILIFLKESGVAFSPYLLELTGSKKALPKLTCEWMEALLQGLLYDDTESYSCEEGYREALISKLKAAGCIHRNKVRLLKNDEVTKLLMSSKGKLNSIIDIVRAEYSGMGDELRLLVLCDFIKKEYLSSVGVEDKAVNELGAVPIFENIRRQNIPGIRLGVLSGSVVILPLDVKEELDSLLMKYSCEGNMTALGETGYAKVDVKGKGQHVVGVVTELFTRGRINTLVGTKSLLGEGWDSPCINSLILATYVGSFMLSNQMRGRAIRVFKDKVDKTSNIWHLACVFPNNKEENDEDGLAGDYETLVRRFEAFLGVSYNDDIVESGIQRLAIGSLTSRKDIERNNKRMLNKSKDRDALRLSWEKSLKVIYDNMRIEEVEEVDKTMFEPGYLFLNAVCMNIGLAIAYVILYFAREFSEAAVQHRSILPLALTALSILVLCAMAKYGFRILSLCTPQKRMKKMAEAILKAMEQTGKMEEPYHCRVQVEEGDIFFAAYLKGGTTRDKTLFAACLEEFFGVIDNPRYLLIRSKGFKRMEDCYTVPEVFGKNKEDAVMFASCMKKALGPYDVVYTRTPEGRKTLLEARTKSFVNKNDKAINGKKKMY